jgi:response regulator of citrate/malate metabolism
MRIGVLLLEPDNDMRYWLGRLIERTDGFMLRGCCAKTEELEKMANRLSPELILLDKNAAVDLETGRLDALRRKLPGLHVALAGLDSEGACQRLAVESGADSFFAKGRAASSLASLSGR